MSTGLSYVTIHDTTSGAPDVQTSPVVFNDYDEAYNWCYWYMSLVRVTTGLNNYLITLWTSGPNLNGYWSIISGTVTFTPFD